jgi:superfamily II DNA or RNA helicase
MKILKPLKLNRKIRRWQELAMRRFYALNKRDFLLVATPGSGKTFVALMIAYQLLLEGKVERIVIVTPTEHLKRQWAEDAVGLGIEIDSTWENASGRESADYWGVAVTYHQISFAPDLYDLNCRKKTLVIFDEVHHTGDNLDWGIKLRHAFRNAEYRLCLSGTLK